MCYLVRQAAIGTFQGHHSEVLHSMSVAQQRNLTNGGGGLNIIGALRHSTKPVRAVNLDLQDHLAIADGRDR